MAIRLEDLDSNSFFKLLQTKYAEKYAVAQKNQWIICIPCENSLQKCNISAAFVDSHILKPSPFFLSVYTSTDAKHSRNYELDERIIKVPEGDKVSILSDEKGYNREYKQFKILITDRPLTPGGQNIINDKIVNSNTCYDGKQDDIVPYDATKLRQLFPDATIALDKKIKQFCSSYMVLPDYLHDAATKLQGILNWAVEVFSESYKRTTKNKCPSSWDLAKSIEFYISSQVHNKIFPVVKKKFIAEDRLLSDTLHSLHESNFTPDQLGVKEIFCCYTLSAVVELASLNLKTSPIEKLLCLLTTLELLNEDIEKSLKETYPAVHLTSDVPHLSSDDLIPLLVHVMVQARPLYLESNLFYVQNFCWNFSGKDRLSFSLVTFQAAKEFVRSGISSYMKPSTSSVKKEITLQELMNIAVEIQENDKNKSVNSTSETSQTAVDRQLQCITQRLEASAKELRECSQKNTRTS